MIPIDRSPARRNLPFVLAVCVMPCLLLAVPTAPLFGDLPLRHALAFACWVVVLPGGVLAYLALAYRPVAFDPATGTARLGRKTVPLASVTSAKRQISAASTAAYVSYRFESTTGAWGRVLLTGRPLKGLSDQGRARLREFVEATAIAPDIDDELTPHQRFLADAGSQFGAKSAVGMRTILAELRGEPPPEARGVRPRHATPAAPADRRDRAAADADDAVADADAEAFLRAQRMPGRAARRVFALLTAAVVVAAFVVIVITAVAEQASGGDLGTDTDAGIGAGLGIAAIAALTSYLSYCIATYRYRRAAQQAALTWLAGQGERQASRGLPPVLLTPFFAPPPAHRLKTLAAYATATIGVCLLVAGGIFLTPELDLPPAAGVSTLAAGTAAAAGSVALFVSAARAQKRQNVLALRLGGTRLEAEMAEMAEMAEPPDLYDISDPDHAPSR